MQDYKQMELDTRKELTKAVEALTAETIGSVEEMILRCGESPAAVRNRHETYGIAAEQLAKIQAIVKSIKNDCGTILGTLSDPNYPAVEATSSIVNSTAEAAAILLIAAAEMKRALNNLYMAENQVTDRTPMEEYMASAGEFEEAETADGEDEDE